MDDRELLMKKISAFGFAAHEWNLYLDTHPQDKDGIAMHHKMVKEANKCIEEYESKYGPLTAAASTNMDCWDWIEDSWPWEKY